MFAEMMANVMETHLEVTQCDDQLRKSRINAILKRCSGIVEGFSYSEDIQAECDDLNIPFMDFYTKYKNIFTQLQ